MGGTSGFSSDILHRSWAASPPPTHSLRGPGLGLSFPLPHPNPSWAGRSEHRSPQGACSRLGQGSRHLGWSELTPSKSRDSGWGGERGGKRATACPPAFCQRRFCPLPHLRRRDQQMLSPKPLRISSKGPELRQVPPHSAMMRAPQEPQNASTPHPQHSATTLAPDAGAKVPCPTPRPLGTLSPGSRRQKGRNLSGQQFVVQTARGGRARHKGQKAFNPLAG